MQEPMKPEQALNILKEAVASIQANLMTHQQIQVALQTVEKELQGDKQSVDSPNVTDTVTPEDELPQN
jgi:hypothetical protein